MGRIANAGRAKPRLSNGNAGGGLTTKTQLAACVLSLAVLASCQQMGTTGPAAGADDAAPTGAAAGGTAAQSSAATKTGAPQSPAGVLAADPGGRQAIEKPEFYRGTGALVRQRPSEPAVDVGAGGQVTINFVNAQIREFIDVILGRTLNLNYIIDPQVDGTVTARTSEPLDREAVIPAVENILALNGAALIVEDGIYKVTTLKVAAASLSAPSVVSLPQDTARGFGTYVIPVRFAAAEGLAEVLKPFIAPNRVLRVDPSRNLLIYAGTGPEASDLIETVDVFDVDWMSGMSFGLFPLQAADPKTVAGELETIFLQNGSPLAGAVRFISIERLNAVLAITPQAAYLRRIEIWVERLDRGSEGIGRRIFVYHVQNGRAGQIAELLTDVFETSRSEAPRDTAAELAPELVPASIGAAQAVPSGGAGLAPQDGEASTGAETATPLPQVLVNPSARISDTTGIATVEESGDIRIIADEANNALVIFASGAEFRMIEATLKRLDLTPLQVLIEATIAEVTLNDTLRYGLQWFFQSGNSSTTLSTLASGGVASAFPGFSYLFASTDSRVVLNALTEITDVRVISSPQLMVLDNKSARLQVGDQVPVATQSAVSVTDADAPVVNSIQFRDTGVILEVTPRVNASGLVTLEILQEVSDVVSTTTSALNSPTIQQRSIQSTVSVQSGDTIALGGLIEDSDQESVSGVPLLSDIPILGNLFKTTSNVTARTELLVLLTPRVVRDRVESQALTEELRKRMSAIEPLEQKIRRQEGVPQ